MEFENSGIKYTTSIEPLSISSKNFFVKFEYQQKEAFEYSVLKIYDGIFAFPIPLENKYYISGYISEIGDYKQKFQFEYKIIENQRLLTNIKQESVSVNDLISFNYNNVFNSVLLEKISVYNGLEISSQISGTKL